jgi:hypothetical protein
LGDPVRFIKTFQHGMFIPFFSTIVWYGSQTKRTKNSYMGLPRFLSYHERKLGKENHRCTQLFCGTCHLLFSPIVKVITHSLSAGQTRIKDGFHNENLADAVIREPQKVGKMLSS